MSKDLYTALIENHTYRPPEVVGAYTHAYSHKQAYRNFAQRYSYPPYVITDVTNDKTGVTMPHDQS